MNEDYSKYSDDMLLKMYEESYDLDEAMFFILTELSNRKHPRIKELCLIALKRDLGFDEYFVASTFSTLYSYDEDAALDYALENFKKFHFYSLGRLISLLWVDSGEEEQAEKKKELIKLVKAYLETFNSEEIIELKEVAEDYDKFMDVYKDV